MIKSSAASLGVITISLATLFVTAQLALGHGGGGGGGSMGGGMGGGAHVGGGGFGGGMSMGSMGSGMSSRGLSGGSNFMGSNLNSARGLGNLGSSSSAGQSLRSFNSPDSLNHNSSINRNLSNIPGLNGGASAHDFSSFNSSRGDSLRSSNSIHSIANRNWQQGEHLSQLHNANLHDGKFGNDKFNNGQFNHDHDFNRFNNFHNRNCFVVAPFWWPVWFGAFDNCYYGYDYGCYDSPYCYYTVGYNSGDYVNDDTLAYNNSEDNGQYPPEYPLPNVGNQPANNSTSGSTSQAGAEYFSQATDAFQGGKYRDALRLANHAAVESPQNPKAPELMSLALFAQGDYRGAAAQAHAALAMGPPTNWDTLYNYYGETAPYTSQLRELEKYVKEKPSAPEGHFLLAYQYLMTGFTKQAVNELHEVAKLAPNDRLSAELIKKYSGDSSTDSLPTPPTPGDTPSSTSRGNSKPIPPQSDDRPTPTTP